MSIAEKLKTIAENEQKVFNAGREQGDYEGYMRGLSEAESSGGYDEGYSDGDLAFFNMFTKNNTRTIYTNGFRYSDFSGYTFPDTVRPVTITSMFNDYTGTSIPKNIDFSNIDQTTTNCSSCFRGAVNLQELDITSMPAPPKYAYMFYVCRSLKRLRLNSNETTEFDQLCFSSCSSLEELEIYGTVGKSLKIADSPLKKNSITNEDGTGVIDVLSSTVSDMTLTLDTKAVTDAFGSTDSDEWKNLISTKSNWTIVLA